MENLVWQDLFPMAKAKLLELQFPVDTYQINGKSWLIPVPISTQKVIRAEYL